MSSTTKFKNSKSQYYLKAPKSLTPVSTASEKHKQNQKRFSNVINKRCSPFASFITKGTSRRSHQISSNNDFAYDLSKDEFHFVACAFKSPMKTVPEHQRELLRSGQRDGYLALRYEHTPDRKYNYPEATSWRIGWLHNQQANKL